MFGFRTRNRQRDHDADQSRQHRLTRLIDDILAEMQAERAGLEARYRAETEQAAFLAEALANERTAPTDWRRVDKLTTSIIGYEMRSASLARQIEVINECRKTIAGLVAINEN